MPKFQCVKTVEAERIQRVRITRNEADDITQITIWPEHSAKELVLTRAMWQRYMPKQGDYLVTYDDGYQSISPAAAFEPGYAQLDDDGIVLPHDDPKLVAVLRRCAFALLEQELRRRGATVQPAPHGGDEGADRQRVPVAAATLAPATRTVFAGTPDQRQAVNARPVIEAGRFRKRYRALTDDELKLHDVIKEQAETLASSIDDVARRAWEDHAQEMKGLAAGDVRHAQESLAAGDVRHAQEIQQAQHRVETRVKDTDLAQTHLEDAVIRAVRALTG